MPSRFQYLLLRVLPKPMVSFAHSLKLIMSGDYIKLRRRVEENERAMRMAATLALKKYETETNAHRFTQTINQHEAKIYSQNGEDGILLHLFSKIGTRNRRFVEFGVGDGRQCNTANLSIHFGWRGLLMESNPHQAKAASFYYRQVLGIRAQDVLVLQTHVTADNINELLSANGYRDEIDLLSIDIDSNDYWIWAAIEEISPRVVVIEYNATLGYTKALTIPYDPHFDVAKAHPSGFYYGASLPALAKLGSKKGYSLVGCESAGVNAFFVRNDLLAGNLQPVRVQNAFFPSARRNVTLDLSSQMKVIEHLELEEV